jgi:TonB family protein
MFNARVALLALPVTLAVGQAALAASLSLSSLTPRTQVAGLGATCSNPVAAARITEPSIQYPLISKIAGREGTADVGIELSATGQVVRAWIVQSSGDANLDRGALQSARASGYAPERSNCAPVAGRYDLGVEFSN